MAKLVCSLKLALGNISPAFCTSGGILAPRGVLSRLLVKGHHTYRQPNCLHRTSHMSSRAAKPLQPSAVQAAPASSAAGILKGREDRYSGLIIDDPQALPETPEQLAESLAVSLPAWRTSGYHGIWLKVPTAAAALIAPAVEAGFEPHHAEQDYVMLTCWLPTDAPSRLPPNASHQVGVGAFVLNEAREVLVVQERWGPLRGKNVWKMVTGLVQQGEDISEAAEREVMEETGVRASFAGVLAMRQAHGLAIGDKSDLFFITALRPEPGQHVLTPQEDEVVAACWLPLEEFAMQPFYQERPLFKTIIKQCIAWAEGRYTGLAGVKMHHGESARQDLLLFGESTGMGGQIHDDSDAWIGLEPPGRA